MHTAPIPIARARSTAAIGVQMDVDGEVGSPMVPARADAHAAINLALFR
jgi:hypothetical protein